MYKLIEATNKHVKNLYKVNFASKDKDKDKETKGPAN